MESLRNNTLENILNKHRIKDYFYRFTKLNVYSYTKSGDKKINLGCKPTEVYSLFNGNTSTNKRTIFKEEATTLHPDEVIVDQSTLQYLLYLLYKISIITIICL